MSPRAGLGGEKGREAVTFTTLTSELGIRTPSLNDHVAGLGGLRRGRFLSITLTYSHQYPGDPEVCERRLKALCKRSQDACS